MENLYATDISLLAWLDAVVSCTIGAKFWDLWLKQLFEGSKARFLK